MCCNSKEKSNKNTMNQMSLPSWSSLSISHCLLSSHCSAPVVRKNESIQRDFPLFSRETSRFMMWKRYIKSALPARWLRAGHRICLIWSAVLLLEVSQVLPLHWREMAISGQILSFKGINWTICCSVLNFPSPHKSSVVPMILTLRCVSEHFGWTIKPKRKWSTSPNNQRYVHR